ncbi:pilus assembly protein [Streptomyces sp. P9(2023)]|uniref:TadE family protein n=1 Tax=Streptomyces sp. P9(2023) TaxID=3064394 RepID=UPI0028F3F947|nr:pilus assembly protein [Streptomyces sp. P9(2023)]MDT9690582.1 pilus assembly protein [Streptomyces sp. P9(2023)]
MNRLADRLRTAVRRRVEAASTRGDSGMSAVEFVFLTPFLFFLIFATVQFALYSFADHVTQAAAQAGAREARTQADENPGWRGEASEVAHSYIDQLGPQLVLDPTVRTYAVQDSVGVEITGRVPSVFPGLDMTVHARSQGPIERFVPEGG